MQCRIFRITGFHIRFTESGNKSNMNEIENNNAAYRFNEGLFHEISAFVSDGN